MSWSVKKKIMFQTQHMQCCWCSIFDDVVIVVFIAFDQTDLSLWGDVTNLFTFSFYNDQVSEMIVLLEEGIRTHYVPPQLTVVSVSIKA